MDKIVTIELDPKTGDMSVDTAGFSGKGCKAIHEAFEAMGKVTKEEIKPEYHQGNSNLNTVHTSH